MCIRDRPGTIDNDLYGTDNTIGYDTTMNTIVECVDRIRDTAQSHERIFFIEVMGRDAGFLAQNSAIASGAEAAIIPEDSTDVDQLAQFMAVSYTHLLCTLTNVSDGLVNNKFNKILLSACMYACSMRCV